jgi:hypothetical protein
MTAHYRRHHRVWTAVLTALLSISLFLTVASAVGLALTQTAAAAPASDSAGQSGDLAAKGDSDIFSRRDAETFQFPYYTRLPLVSKSFHPYNPVVTSRNYLTGVFAFGGILTCVLGGLVVLTRRK